MVDELCWYTAGSGSLYNDQMNREAYHRYAVFIRTRRSAAARRCAAQRGAKINFSGPRRVASRRSGPNIPALRGAARHACRFTADWQRSARGANQRSGAAQRHSALHSAAASERRAAQRRAA